MHRSQLIKRKRRTGVIGVSEFALWVALSGSALADNVAGLDDNALKAAAQDFQSLCASCHGATGRGDGPAASALKVQPPDLTRIAQRNDGTFPDAFVWGKIWGLDMPVSHGTRDMPVWGSIFIEAALGKYIPLPSILDAVQAGVRVNQRMDHLVKYLQTIQVAK